MFQRLRGSRHEVSGSEQFEAGETVSWLVPALLIPLGSIAPVGSAIIRDVFVWSAPLTMDQPRQRVPNGSCHKQREQRALCHPVGYGLLALANVPLCLRVLFSCLSGVALALAVTFLAASVALPATSLSASRT